MPSPSFSTCLMYQQKRGKIKKPPQYKMKPCAVRREQMAALTICRPGYSQHRSALFLVFFIVCLSVVCSPAYAIGGNVTDRLGLLEFKATITADPLGIMNTWNDSTHFCKWFGVTCGKRHQRVTKLILRSMQLGGSISAHVGNLTFLRILDLYNNTLINQIPPELGYLKRLEILYLRHNSLSGEIPSTLSRCTELVILNLVNNMLSGAIPNELGLLSKLQYFSVYSNNLTGEIAPSLGNLSSLSIFSVGANNLVGSIPDALGQLNRLTYLQLGANKLSGSVPSLQKLNALNMLSIFDNYLGTRGPDDLNFLCSLTNASDLQVLAINSNDFGGSLPECIGSLSSKLLIFKLGDNQISGRIPAGIVNLVNLMFLDVSTNYFSGAIPESLGNLTNLNVLSMTQNNLHGNIPLGLGKCANLQFVDLSRNNLSGSLPAEVIGLSLVDFSIEQNNIHGRIPQSLCNATKLEILDLGANHFSGTIPDCLGGMLRTLGVLDLSGNNLGGTIPDEFGKDCRLEILDLCWNFLQGQIPRSLANCEALKLLDLESNQLRDTFPCELSTLSELRVLILKSNKFSGTIACPGKDSFWPVLQILTLASNHFSGELTAPFIPKWRSMITGTQELQSKPDHLQFNDSIGGSYQDAIMLTFKENSFVLRTIPRIFTSIDFSNNAFQGEVPRELGNLNALIVLNLSHNSLSGSIPSSFGNLSQLESLDLSCNALSGNIPQELANLNFLESLNVSFNKLAGPIPKSTQLQSFNASSYQGNPGLYGPPLTPTNVPGVLYVPPTPSDEMQWSSKSEVGWMLRGAEVGFPVGLTIFVGPLLYIKRWTRWYCRHLGRLVMKMMGKEDQSRGRRRRRQQQLQRH